VPSLKYKTRGDLYFTVKVSVPRKLNDTQKDILRKFSEAGGDSTGDHKTFFDKVKDAFK
jgi:molecular chaperone DnaJ